MKTKVLFILALLGVCSCTTDPSILFEKGKRYYSDGQIDKAIDCYKKSAEHGCIQAQLFLGKYYLDNNQPEQAVAFYKLAADQGDAVANRCLGKHYYAGSGVEQSYEEAARRYEVAAEKGDAEAQAILGNCYILGSGVEKSVSKSIKWHRASAEQGFAVSQYIMGCFYEEGVGVEQSISEAKRWYQKAANQGYDDAIERLELLEWSAKQVPNWLFGEWVSDKIDIDVSTYETITSYLEVTSYGYRVDFVRSGGGGYHLDWDWELKTEGNKCYNNNGDVIFSINDSHTRLEFSGETWHR